MTRVAKDLTKKYSKNVDAFLTLQTRLGDAQQGLNELTKFQTMSKKLMESSSFFDNATTLSTTPTTNYSPSTNNINMNNGSSKAANSDSSCLLSELSRTREALLCALCKAFPTDSPSMGVCEPGSAKCRALMDLLWSGKQCS